MSVCLHLSLSLSLSLQVTKDSLAKAADMQDRLTDAHARFSESSKRVQEVESERRKLEFSLQQAQVCTQSRVCTL